MSKSVADLTPDDAVIERAPVTSVVLDIGDERTTVTSMIEDVAAATYVIPRGMMTLQRAHIASDPPLPHELTNAIGDMMDHLDDAARDLPELAAAQTVILAGRAAATVAAVEVGGPPSAALFDLGRDAAEDVFRTLATEAAAQRRHNPGLPADLVDIIVGGCCAVVAVFRRLDRVAVRVCTVAVEPS